MTEPKKKSSVGQKTRFTKGRWGEEARCEGEKMLEFLLNTLLLTEWRNNPPNNFNSRSSSVLSTACSAKKERKEKREPSKTKPLKECSMNG